MNVVKNDNKKIFLPLIQAYQNSHKKSAHGAVRCNNEYGLQAFSELRDNKIHIIICLLGANKDLSAVFDLNEKEVMIVSSFTKDTGENYKILNAVISKMVNHLSSDNSKYFSNKGIGYYSRRLAPGQKHGHKSNKNFGFVVKNKIISEQAREMATKNGITFYQKGLKDHSVSVVNTVKRYNFTNATDKSMRVLSFLDNFKNID